MTELFTLTLSDNNESVDFIGSIFKVKDGGFDIGTVEADRLLYKVRPGFFRLAQKERKFRKATIDFSIHGATRSSVLASLAKLERIITSIEDQTNLTRTTRGQLSYAFDGATSKTYFEVYSAEIRQPSDLLSVRVAHAVDGSGYYIQDIQVTLYLSPVGYGLSIFTSILSSNELPIKNASTPTKTTGGINIGNFGNDSGYSSYIEVDDTDIPGGQPWVTAISMRWTSSISYMHHVYFGRHVYPYPTTSHLILSSEASGSSYLMQANTGTDFSTRTYDTDALDDYYLTRSFTYFPQGDLYYPELYWILPSLFTTGRYLPFWVGFLGNVNFTAEFTRSFGIWQYSDWGIEYVPEHITDILTSQNHYRCAPLPIPPANPAVTTYGTPLKGGLWIGFAVAMGGATSGTGTFDFDYGYLLPITDGLRVWNMRETPNPTTETIIDDNWQGKYYGVDTSTNVWQSYIPSMTPISLSPAKDQRIYITTVGGVQTPQGYERNVTAVARLYGVPTFETLAY